MNDQTVAAQAEQVDAVDEALQRPDLTLDVLPEPRYLVTRPALELATAGHILRAATRADASIEALEAQARQDAAYGVLLCFLYAQLRPHRHHSAYYRGVGTL